MSLRGALRDILFFYVWLWLREDGCGKYYSGAGAAAEVRIRISEGKMIV